MEINGKHIIPATPHSEDMPSLRAFWEELKRGMGSGATLFFSGRTSGSGRHFGSGSRYGSGSRRGSRSAPSAVPLTASGATTTRWATDSASLCRT